MPPVTKKQEPNIPMPVRLSEKRTEPVSGIALLSYGASGSGKTWFAGTAGSRTLYLDIGRSTRTLKSKQFKTLFPETDPLIVEIPEDFDPTSPIPEKAVAFDTLNDVLEYQLRNHADDFDTVVVDDASYLRKAAMYKGLEANQKLGKSKSQEASKANDILVIGVQDYGTEMSLIEQLCAQYTEVICREYKKNFILLAHQRQVFSKPKDQSGRVIIGEQPTLEKIMPGFTGQTFPDVIPMYFDWVFYHDSVPAERGTVYRVRTQGTDVITAKCRDGGVFKNIELNPNFTEFLSRISASNSTNTPNKV